MSLVGVSPPATRSDRFEGKVAFITGAGRGQGANHALQLAAQGADVALVDLGGAGTVEHPSYRTATVEQLNDTADRIRRLGRRATVAEVDVRDPEGLVRAAASAADALGGIDYVIANAGITDGYHRTWELPVENWRTMIDINLSGVFYTCRAVIPYLLKRGQGCALVLISSGVGISPVPGLAHYVASKMALRGLGASLAAELGPFGIRCNTIHPGGIDTEMTSAMVELNGTPREELLREFRSGQLIDANIERCDSSAAVLWLLSDEARYVTGLEMTVDAGESIK